MRIKDGNVNRSRHSKAALQQRPIEALSVERNQHGMLSQPARKLEQDRIFLSRIAHEKLFDLDSACIPPCQANQKRQISPASDEAGRFGIQKEPFLGVQRMICAKARARRPRVEQKSEGVGIRLEPCGRGIPLACRYVRPESIARNLSP